MKYCQQCGSQLVDQADVCPNCGCAVQAPVSQQEDKPSTGLNILAFLFPLVGLILYLCFQKTTPVRAKRSANGRWTASLSVLRSRFWSGFWSGFWVPCTHKRARAGEMQSLHFTRFLHGFGVGLDRDVLCCTQNIGEAAA